MGRTGCSLLCCLAMACTTTEDAVEATETDDVVADTAEEEEEEDEEEEEEEEEEDTGLDTETDTGPPPDTAGATGDSVTWDTAPCPTRVDAIWPAARADDVYVDPIVVVELSDPDPTAQVRVLQAGTPVSGRAQPSSQGRWWRPTAPLAPSTSYTIEVTTCSGRDITRAAFETGAVGPAPTGVVGSTYVFDGIRQGHFRLLEPPGASALVAALIDDLDERLAMQVVSAGGGRLDLRFALVAQDGGAGPWLQDLCATTVDRPTPAGGLPFLSDALHGTTLTFGGTAFPVEAAEASAAFEPDGSRLVGVRTRLVSDARDVAATGFWDDAFGGRPTPTEVCTLIGSFGLGGCSPCPSDGQPYCRTTWLDDGVADRVSGLALVPRTQPQIDADPACTP